MRYLALMAGVMIGAAALHILIPAPAAEPLPVEEPCFYGRFESYAEYINHDRPEHSFVRLSGSSLNGPVEVEVRCKKKGDR